MPPFEDPEQQDASGVDAIDDSVGTNEDLANRVVLPLRDGPPGAGMKCGELEPLDESVDPRLRCPGVIGGDEVSDRVQVILRLG